MNTYLVKVSTPEDRERLLDFCEKVGKPRAMKTLLVVKTDLLAEELMEIEGVVAVEEDDETDTPDYIDPADVIVQTGPSNWFLKGLSDNPHYRYTRTGEGVDIYILDSGIRPTHEEFEGRVETLYSYDDKEWDSSEPASPSHGTMCAGCAAGKLHGVAKKAKIYNMRYNWRNTEAIKAIDVMIEHHQAKPNDRGSVLSTSFSTRSSLAYEESAREVTEAGIVWCGSAGNDREAAARYPAGNENVIGVACLSTYRGNWRQLVPASYTNYGPGVNVWAPGDGGTVAGIQTDTDTQRAGGTSAACPVTAGIVAMILEGSAKLTTKEEVLAAHEALFAHCNDRATIRGKYADTVNRTPTSLIDPELIITEMPVPEPEPEPTPIPPPPEEPDPEPVPHPRPTPTPIPRNNKPKWYKKDAVKWGGLLLAIALIAYIGAAL